MGCEVAEMDADTLDDLPFARAASMLDQKVVASFLSAPPFPNEFEFTRPESVTVVFPLPASLQTAVQLITR